MARLEQRDHCDHGAALLDLFARGSELTRRLVDETEQLRRLAAEVADGSKPDLDSDAPGRSAMGLRPSEVQLETLRDENHDLLERLRAVEASNARWAERHAETERGHDDLANLFVASDQLHATRDADEVVAAICEIVINLIGAEIFAIYSYEEPAERLLPFVSEGRALAGLSEVALGEGVIGRAVARGGVWVAESGSADLVAAEVGDPLAVVPLCARGRALGAIAIYKLLEQKSGLSELDHQLFALLAQHAATALLVARLESTSSNAPRQNPSPIDRITN